MTWNYAYIPQIWPSLLTVLFLLAMVFYSSRRRSVPGVLPFMAGCLFVALRLYGPLQPWFDKTRRPGEVEMVD